jgi:hypothetical protein
VTGIGAFALGGLVWVYWPAITAFAMYINDAPAEHLAALQPDNEGQYDAYSRLLERLLVLYGFAAYGVYRIAMRSNVHIPRGVTACAIALPVLALLTLREFQYRIVYQNKVFERVDLGETRCYEIGMRPGEVLLHCPDVAPPRNQVVASTDPRLRPRGVFESVFSPREKSRIVE